MLHDLAAHEFHVRVDLIHAIDTVFDTDPALEAFLFNVPNIPS